MVDDAIRAIWERLRPPQRRIFQKPHYSEDGCLLVDFRSSWSLEHLGFGKVKDSSWPLNEIRLSPLGWQIVEYAQGKYLPPREETMAWKPEDRDRYGIRERKLTIEKRLADEPILAQAEQQTLEMMELLLPAIPTQDLQAELQRRHERELKPTNTQLHQLQGGVLSMIESGANAGLPREQVLTDFAPFISGGRETLDALLEGDFDKVRQRTETTASHEPEEDETIECPNCGAPTRIVTDECCSQCRPGHPLRPNY